MQRSLLLLEGLWDQLEVLATAITLQDEQPSTARASRVRASVYATRLRTLLAGSSLAGEADHLAVTRKAMSEVAALLDQMTFAQGAAWSITVFAAQDVVLDALHELRSCATTHLDRRHHADALRI